MHCLTITTQNHQKYVNLNNLDVKSCDFKYIPINLNFDNFYVFKDKNYTSDYLCLFCLEDDSGSSFIAKISDLFLFYQNFIRSKNLSSADLSTFCLSSSSNKIKRTF